MARAFTRLQIQTRARFHANLQNSNEGFLDARVQELLDTHKAAIWLELVKASPPDYYTADTTFNTVQGTLSYALPADFLKVGFVFAQIGTEGRRQLRELAGSTRGLYQSPQGSYPIIMEYIPTAPIWANDTDTFDGIAGYEELIAKLTARDILIAEESFEQAQALDMACQEELARLRGTAKRSVGAQEITDVTMMDDEGWWSGTNPIRAFRVRAGNVEFYQARTSVP